MCLKCETAINRHGRSHVYEADQYDHKWIRCEETHKLYHVMIKKNQEKVTEKEMDEVERFRADHPTQQSRMNYYYDNNIRYTSKQKQEGPE